MSHQQARLIELSVTEEDAAPIRARLNAGGQPSGQEDLVTDQAAVPSLSADGKHILATSTIGHSVVAIDRGTSREIKTTSPHKDKVTCMATLGNGGDFVTGSADQSVRVWDSDGLQLQHVDTMVFNDTVTHIAAHPTLKLVAVCLNNKVIKLRHLANKPVDEIRIELQDSTLTCLLLHDSQLIYGTNLGKVFVWNYEDHENPVFLLYGHVSPIKLLSLSDNRLASYAQNDSQICVWNVKAGKLKYRIDTDQKQYTAMHLDGPKHMLFLTSVDKNFHMYCTQTKRLVISETLPSQAHLIQVGNQI